MNIAKPGAGIEKQFLFKSQQFYTIDPSETTTNSFKNDIFPIASLDVYDMLHSVDYSISAALAGTTKFKIGFFDQSTGEQVIPDVIGEITATTTPLTATAVDLKTVKDKTIRMLMDNPRPVWLAAYGADADLTAKVTIEFNAVFSTGVNNVARCCPPEEKITPILP